MPSVCVMVLTQLFDERTKIKHVRPQIIWKQMGYSSNVLII